MSVNTERPLRPRSWRRPLLRWLGLLALIYVGAVAVLLFFENRLVYRGTTAAQGWQSPPNDQIQDVTFSISSGVQVHAWWLPCAGGDGAILYAHGNAGNLSHRGKSIVALSSELKMSVLIFDYPGYGKSSGSPTEQGCYEAALAAHDWLTQTQKISGEKIMLYGGSLGGGVAVEVATKRPCRGLLLAKTFTALPDVAALQYPWVPVHWLMSNRFDSLAKIGSIHRPVIITHGDRDGLIPFEQGKRLYEAANEPKIFYHLNGGDHDSGLPLDFFRAVVRFLEKAEGTPTK